MNWEEWLQNGQSFCILTYSRQILHICIVLFLQGCRLGGYWVTGPVVPWPWWWRWKWAFQLLPKKERKLSHGRVGHNLNLGIIMASPPYGEHTLWRAELSISNYLSCYLLLEPKMVWCGAGGSQRFPFGKLHSDCFWTEPHWGCIVAPGCKTRENSP